MLNGGVNERITLATRVTLLRILGVPVFILLTLYFTEALDHGEPMQMERWLALTVFALVAATDALDGYLARSRGEITKLGTILDPLADKALILSALLLLTRPGLSALQPKLPLWLTVLVVSRDFLLFAGSWLVHAVAGTLKVKPSFIGKTGTFLMMGCIIWVLAGWSGRYFLTMTVFTGVCIGVSATQYFWSGLRQLEAGLEQRAAQHRAIQTQRTDPKP